MEERKDIEVIDIRILFKKLYAKRKLFFKVCPITFVLACLYILCIPRYYTSDTKLAPELSSSMDMGGIGSIASSFGIDINNMQSSDAINPLLYPDLMEDDGFVTKMFPVRVKTLDGDIDTDYYTYLRNYQKAPWWAKVRQWLFGFFKSKKENGTEENAFNPYHMSEDDNDVAEAIRGNISLSTDKKTGVITISTNAQDPLVCKTLADTMQVYLQEYITNYRTNKARIDVEHYEQLTEEARKEYEQLSQQYARYTDSNQNAIKASVQTKIDNLIKEMQVKYTTYTTLTAQLEVAKSKLQERTPAFTVIKGASVPIKPAGPKRMIFVAAMLFISILGTAFYIVKDDIFSTERQ